MAKTRKVPQRTCVGCGTVKAKKDLVRVVRSPDGTIGIDRTGKKSGRGAYLCPVQGCLERALKRNALSRTLDVTIPDDVIDLLHKELSEYDV